MDEKIYDLLEKLYIEVQEIKGTMATKDELMEVKGTMATKEDLRGLSQVIVRLENKMDMHHKALYDGYQQSIEGINDLRERVDNLTQKVDNQEIKLRVIK